MKSSRPLAASEVERYHAALIELADEARRVAAPLLERGFATEMKKDASPVTEIDRAIELRLRELIAARFPEHGVIGEEFPAYQPESAFQWILDPIDGTEELVHGVPTWGAILALHCEGAPVVGLIDHPALSLRVSAGRGLGTWRNGKRVRLREPSGLPRPEAVRLMMSARFNFMRGVDEGHLFDALARRFPNHRVYRAAYAHTAVVTGGGDAMVDAHNAIWDLAAAQILAEEAGGSYRVVRDLPGPEGRMLTAVFGRPDVVEQVMRLFE